MINRRRFLAASAALAAAPSAARAQGLLRISITPTIFPELFSEIVKRYEAANPGFKISVEGRYRSQELQLAATLRQGLISELPDLSFQGFAYLPQLKRLGYTVALDQLLAAEPRAVEQGLAGAVITPNIVDGELHGLGVGMSFPIIYVNLTLAERAGVRESELPTDWPGIIALARKIGALGTDVQGGYFQHASGDNWTWVALVESLGARMMTEDGRLGFLGPEGLRALEIIRAFGDLGQSRYDASQDQSRTVFAAGIVGVLVDSSSSLANFEKTAGERFRIRTIPLPLAPNGQLPAAGIASVMHTRDPRLQQAAWRFMAFASGPDGQVLVGKHTGYAPANKVAVETPALLGDYYAARPSYRAGLGSVARAARWFIFPGEKGEKLHLEVKDHLRLVATSRLTPAEGLAAIERSARQMIPNLKG